MGVKITKPCFIVYKNKIILPAYGTYTGGLNIKSIEFKKIFKPGFKAYALGNKKVFRIENNNLLKNRG